MICASSATSRLDTSVRLVLFRPFSGDAFIPTDDAETLHSTLRDLLAPGHGVAKMVWDDGGHLSLSCDAFGFTSGGVYMDAIRAAFRLLESSNKIEASDESWRDGEGSLSKNSSCCVSSSASIKMSDEHTGKGVVVGSAPLPPLDGSVRV